MAEPKVENKCRKQLCRWSSGMGIMCAAKGEKGTKAKVSTETEYHKS